MKASDFTVLLVPGLRDETPEHWQRLLAKSQPNVRALPALGRRACRLGCSGPAEPSLWLR